ncbi:hypothetical protein LCGC14_2047280 [marine sediment metagenome]|uniref:Uncharacterized protein n=1 Tax=marine sediment metagenome TaxID=412755 RepID=A0A0F9EPZ9_9ZZZZ
MAEMGTAMERPNLPKRLENIEALLQSSREIVSRIQSPDEEKAELAPEANGIEAAAAHIEQGLQRLNARLIGIADRIGQL